ncbi:DoxX family protein [Sinomicrobium weinanense]|uniref:DoxX family protein n=1 Tax=Sinomicrobium weinanense TaxID=2842200 RepID=A0A926JTP9_9FLAO|nr:DoxX family protein [Sinomicrobium weinanense]MBC9797315.1 DoxX family protein [Sinomicrobium weinanense]MBU3122784.1 DoxX family protein [Sinomicrobium weinanense]
MGTVKTLNKWANAHTYYPLDLLRIALGVFLFLKGTSFIVNSQYLIDIIKPIQNWWGAMLTVHYVAHAHLLGGILIVFGLLTRLSIAVQIPILIGAIAINFIGEMHSGNLIASSVTFLICIFFLIYGSGKHSADYYFKMQQ